MYGFLSVPLQHRERTVLSACCHINYESDLASFGKQRAWVEKYCIVQCEGNAFYPILAVTCGQTAKEKACTTGF